jgi:hypothetical protein
MAAYSFEIEDEVAQAVDAMRRARTARVDLPMRKLHFAIVRLRRVAPRSRADAMRSSVTHTDPQILFTAASEPGTS